MNIIENIGTVNVKQYMTINRWRILLSLMILYFTFGHLLEWYYHNHIMIYTLSQSIYANEFYATMLSMWLTNILQHLIYVCIDVSLWTLWKQLVTDWNTIHRQLRQVKYGDTTTDWQQVKKYTILEFGKFYFCSIITVTEHFCCKREV